MRPILIVIFILVLIGLSLGGWYLYSQQVQTPQGNPPPTPTTAAEEPTTQPSPGPTSTSQLPTTYITAVDWPPQVNVEHQPYRCTEAGSPTDRSGKTQQIVANGHTYCRTEVTEGAAGSIYTQYAYARAKNDQTEIFTFSLRFVQCGNYSEPEQTACERERQTFNIDTFIDTYIQSNF